MLLTTRIWVSAVLFLSWIHAVSSFVILLPRMHHRHCRHQTSTSLSVSSPTDMGGDGSWKLPNDFETFLNQCTIQSFTYLLKTLRDPHTILWMERFTEPAIAARPIQANAEPTGASSNSRLLTYHGLAAMNTTIFPTWQSYFEKLLEQPTEVHMIESNTAWAPDYELEISPPRLCSRLVSVREQIAREWVGDLAVIANMGGLTLDAYWARLRQERDTTPATSDSDPSRTLLRSNSNLLFLEFDPMMSDDYMPSPLRKGNFDLLCLLATQEAVHRILNGPTGISGGEDATKLFLQDFYVSRLLSNFTGSKWYGMADDFLEKLLSEAPRTLQVDGQGMFLVNPTSVAELVLDTRRAVALEWQIVVKDVPNRHIDIKRKQLNLLIGNPMEAITEEPFQ